MGGKLKYRFSEVYGRHRIKHAFTTPDIPRLDGYTERGLADLKVTPLASRVRAGSLFGGVNMPSTSDNLWAEAAHCARDSLRKAATPAYLNNKSTY